VDVDRATGLVKVLRYTIIQDAGKAIFPDYVEAQFHGAAVQGIGLALNEEYIYNDKGVMENPGFLDYRVPVASDVPNISTEIVEVPNPLHPYGVRGVGEVSIIPPLAVISNAIYDAVGIRLRDHPMSPPKVLKALDDAALKKARPMIAENLDFVFETFPRLKERRRSAGRQHVGGRAADGDDRPRPHVEPENPSGG